MSSASFTTRSMPGIIFPSAAIAIPTGWVGDPCGCGMMTISPRKAVSRPTPIATWRSSPMSGRARSRTGIRFVGVSGRQQLSQGVSQHGVGEEHGCHGGLRGRRGRERGQECFQWVWVGGKKHSKMAFRSTTPEHVCEQCGKAFPQRWRLNRHVATHAPLSLHDQVGDTKYDDSGCSASSCSSPGSGREGDSRNHSSSAEEENELFADNAGGRNRFLIYQFRGKGRRV